MYNKYLKGMSDVLCACVLCVLVLPVLGLVAIMVKISSRGSILFVSDRVGRNNKIFKMYKYRTMKQNTPQLATHLMKDPGLHLTSVGSFLRKTSLDELPQLFNIIKRDMSFVGPRPALFNQDDLVAGRIGAGVHLLVPGITGWAQTHGRDEISIPEKVDLDMYYLNNRGLLLDLKIIWLTFANVVCRRDVAH